MSQIGIDRDPLGMGDHPTDVTPALETGIDGNVLDQQIVRARHRFDQCHRVGGDAEEVDSWD